MNRVMKKHYRYMDLSYDATVEEVLTREKVMIKMIRSNNSEKHADKKVNKVAMSANAIIEYINAGGKINNSQPWFEINKKTIFKQILICMFVVALAVVSLLNFVY